MILNQTQRKIISEKEIWCNGFFSQLRGLMFRPKQNLVMLFPTERKMALHMFFVFYSIDVLLVNEELKIVEIGKSLKPWSIWQSQKKGKYLVELASFGEYSPGDILVFTLSQNKV